MITAPDLFGTRTGRHTHPDTHPQWMEFSDGNCPRCRPELAEMICDQRPRIGDTRACPDCGRPQHYTGAELGWCHDALIDMWDCSDPARAHKVAL